MGPELHVNTLYQRVLGTHSFMHFPFECVLASFAQGLRTALSGCHRQFPSSCILCHHLLWTLHNTAYFPAMWPASHQQPLLCIYVLTCAQCISGKMFTRLSMNTGKAVTVRGEKELKIRTGCYMPWTDKSEIYQWEHFPGSSVTRSLKDRNSNP